MKPNDFDPASVRVWVVALMIATTALLAVSFHQKNLASRKQLNDDDLVFYYNALSIDAPEHFAALNAKVSEYLSHKPINVNCNCLYEKYRFDLREKFRNNYVLYHYALNDVRQVLKPFTQGEGMDYATSIGSTMLATSYFGFAAALALMWIVVCGFVRLDLVIALSLGVVVMQVVSSMSPYHPPFWELRVRPSSLSDGLAWLRNVLFLLISPSNSIVDWFPRPLSMLLTVGVFLLRWSGWPTIGYAILAIIIGVHQGNGSLVLFTLLAIDVLLYPRRLRQGGSLVGIGCALAALLLPNGLLGDTTGVSGVDIVLAVIALAAVLLLDLSLSRVGWRPIVIFDQWRALIRHLGPISVDLLGILVLWFAWSAVSLMMYFHVGKPQGVYTWGDLPARYLMVFRGPVFIGLVAMAAALALRWCRSEILAGLAGAACLAMIAVQLPITGADRIAQLARSLLPLESELQPNSAGQIEGYDEALTYYAIAKTIETNEDVVTPLLKVWQSRDARMLH
jgi:hypothetical protein